MSHAPAVPQNTLASRIASAIGSSPLDCYQCGRCSAGCFQNIEGEMELGPTRIMRLLQLEAAFAHDAATALKYAGRALESETIWLCAGCLACTTRCPQEVDIAGVMDALREESLRTGVASQTKRCRDIQAFHRTFLGAALKHGRVHELPLVMGYKLRTGHLLQDALLAPAMLRRGKLHLLPGEKSDTTAVQGAIEKLNADEAEGGTAK